MAVAVAAASSMRTADAKPTASLTWNACSSVAASRGLACALEISWIAAVDAS
jgi:hypothetical protein